jgi:transposase
MCRDTERVFTVNDSIRLGAIEAVLQGRHTVRQAANALGRSRRQVFRLKSKVANGGPEAILHGNRGRRPSNAFDPDVRRQIIELYCQEHEDFNFSHFADHLRDKHAIRISPQTLRRWLRAEGLGRPVRRQKTHRRRRTRKARFGEMLFLDGSFHPWFGPHYEPCTLILASDDATGQGLWGCFVPHEDRNSCFRTAYHVFQRYGLPACWYLDRASQFTTTRPSGTQEDKVPTAFEMAMQTLAVPIVFARSPQARGRGERLNGSLQDRLVAEFLHNRIHDLPQATRYLNRSFLPRYNKRFARSPADPSPAWRPLPLPLDLKSVLCAKTQRIVDNDNTFAFNGSRFQILPTRHYRHLVKARIQVQHRFDDTIHAFHSTHGHLKISPLPKGDIFAERTG